VPADWILAIETSVTEASLALFGNDELVAEEAFTSERSQECDLFAPLGRILAKVPKQEGLQAVVVGTGPGSYNGARVGIAAAQAIAQTHHCGVAGLCSFEGVDLVHQNPQSRAVGDARRGSWFIIEILDGRIASDPQLLNQSEFLDEVSGSTSPLITFESPDRLPGEVPAKEVTSSAATLIQSWLSRSIEEQEKLLKVPPEAFYLRPPHITKSKKKLH